jgi:hypothetical protein
MERSRVGWEGERGKSEYGDNSGGQKDLLKKIYISKNI